MNLPVPVSTNLNTSSLRHPKLFNTVSYDTSYTPHKKGNGWSYCAGTSSYPNWSGGVILDTIINNKSYFTRVFQNPSSHYPISIYRKSIIDTLGNYFELADQSGYPDTLLLIKLSAVSGDTIYNNPQSQVKVIVINTNETFENCTNCYHVKVIYPTTYPTHHYFKKGIGDIVLHSFKLSNAIIK